MKNLRINKIPSYLLMIIMVSGSTFMMVGGEGSVSNFFKNVSLSAADYQAGGDGNPSEIRNWLNIDDLTSNADYADILDASHEPTIAIIDSGIDSYTYGHIGGADTVSMMYSFEYHSGVCVLVEHGDTSSFPSAMNDNEVHGSPVVDLLYNLNPHVKFIIYKYMFSGASKQQQAECITQAMAHVYNTGNPRADIINLSAGVKYTDIDQDTYDWMLEVVNALSTWNVPVVVSSGNSGDTSNHNLLYPAYFSSTIAVGGLEPSGATTWSSSVDKAVRAPSSSYGSRLDFTTPGRYIDGNIPNDQGDGFKHVLLSGTSFAAPVFSAMLAYALSAFHVEYGEFPKDDYYDNSLDLLMTHIYDATEPSVSDGTTRYIRPPTINHDYSVARYDEFGYGLLDIYDAIPLIMTISSDSSSGGSSGGGGGGSGGGSGVGGSCRAICFVP